MEIKMTKRLKVKVFKSDETTFLNKDIEEYLEVERINDNSEYKVETHLIENRNFNKTDIVVTITHLR